MKERDHQLLCFAVVGPVQHEPTLRSATTSMQAACTSHRLFSFYNDSALGVEAVASRASFYSGYVDGHPANQQMLQHAWTRVLEGCQVTGWSWHWVAKLDPDTLLRPDSLLPFLRDYSPSKPILLGEQVWANSRHIVLGGQLLVASRAALRRWKPSARLSPLPGQRWPQPEWWKAEDVWMSMYMARNGAQLLVPPALPGCACVVDGRSFTCGNRLFGRVHHVHEPGSVIGVGSGIPAVLGNRSLLCAHECAAAVHPLKTQAAQDVARRALAHNRCERAASAKPSRARAVGAAPRSLALALRDPGHSAARGVSPFLA